MNQSPIPFPKVNNLELGENYLSDRGIEYLFETKLPMITQLADRLAKRLPDLRLTGEPVYKGQLHVHGLASLPVAW